MLRTVDTMHRRQEPESLSRRSLLRRSVVAGAAACGATGALARAADRDREGFVAQAAVESSRSDSVEFPISLNTSTLRGHKLPIRKTIEIAAKAGYRGIEPWPNEIDDFLRSGGKLRDLDKELRDNGLRVTGAIAFFEWMVSDGTRRARGLEGAKRFMEKLAAIRATHVAAPPSGPGDDVDNVELLAAAERYRALLEVSEEFGVVPAVEVWGFRKNLNRLGEALLVAVEAQHPKACVLPDVYHLYKGGSGLSGIRFLRGDALGGFHLNDYPDIPLDRIHDRDRVYPGDGVAPLGQFFRDLRDTGYRGPLSIELFNPEYWKQDPMLVAQTALDKTKAVMAAALAK